MTIEGIVLPGKIRTTQIIEYIERHLQAFRPIGPEVAVGDHICTFREPAIVETLEFFPSETQVQVLGRAKLEVRVAQAPLSLEDVGISVTAGVGNCVAVETAGVDRKELGNYLFGEIDVPSLETFEERARTVRLVPVS